MLSDVRPTRRSGKGAESATGVVCRGCYREVDLKFGGPSSLAIARA